jgi:hypothetical protein
MLLSRFSVPLLFYSPGLPAIRAKRLRTVASQVDITPSVLGLLGIDAPHQCWGRNLFAVPGTDPGFAVVKPSGGEDEVALIEGDYILIKYPRKKLQLYRFSLGFPPEASIDLALEEPDRCRRMEKKLDAYVQSGIQLLKRRQLGAPAKVPGAALPETTVNALAIDSHWAPRPNRSPAGADSLLKSGSSDGESSH